MTWHRSKLWALELVLAHYLRRKKEGVGGEKVGEEKELEGQRLGERRSEEKERRRLGRDRRKEVRSKRN